MAITSEPDSSPAAVLRAAGELIASVSDRLAAGFTDDELVAGVEEVQQVSARLSAAQARLVAEAHQRDLARKKLRWGSTADWVTHCAGINRRDGARVVRHSLQLVSEQTVTLAAMDRGETSPVQAAVICDAIDALPGARDLRERAETLLNDQAKVLTATELTRAARHVVRVVDPGGSDRRDEAALDRLERAAHRDRFLSVGDDGAGGVRIKGRGSVEEGEVLRAALLPLTRPAPALDPDDPTCESERDPRDHGARMWDALVQTAQHALDADLPPESHGTAPDPASSSRPATPLVEEVAQRPSRDLPRRRSQLTDASGQSQPRLPRSRDRRCAPSSTTAARWLADARRASLGCTRPPSMCHAHHIDHWADGGTTSLDNLVMLCGEHHRVIHHTPWQVRLNPDDGRPEFLPPPRGSDSTRVEETWVRHRPRREQAPSVEEVVQRPSREISTAAAGRCGTPAWGGNTQAPRI